MKTTRNILSALIAAGAPVVALLALSDLVPADLAIAGITALGLFAFAIYDFSRNTASLEVRATILRPALPVATPRVSASSRKAA